MAESATAPHESRLCFPIRPQCSNYHATSRCRNEVKSLLFAPDGKAVPGCYLCAECGEDITKEYRLKLNEHWALVPIHITAKGCFP